MPSSKWVPFFPVRASVASFINRRLRLKVNESKSAVARPETRHFLGYRLQPAEGGPSEVLMSERSERRLRERIRELTPRSRGWSLEATINEVNAYLQGWFGHFRVCTPGVERSIQRKDLFQDAAWESGSRAYDRCDFPGFIQPQRGKKVSLTGIAHG